jgi:hypothetical protein
MRPVSKTAQGQIRSIHRLIDEVLAEVSSARPARANQKLAGGFDAGIVDLVLGKPPAAIPQGKSA